MIRLTDREMQTIRNEIIRYVSLESNTGMQALSRDTAKAQLKKVIEWGKVECLEHGSRHRDALIKSLEEMNAEKPYFPRRLCCKCWQALLEEAK